MLGSPTMPSSGWIRSILSLNSLPSVASATVILVGSLVLAGWMLDIVPLKSALAGLATMKANTALAFLLAGVALRLSQRARSARGPRRAAAACAFTVALVGLLTFSEYLFGWDLGIDQLLVTDTRDTTVPGQMAPAAALNFLLVGCALLLLDTETRRGYRPAQFIILLAAAISLSCLFGYAYGLRSLYGYGPAPHMSMALHTAALFVVLCVGILCARPDCGMAATVMSAGAGGIMVRRLLPATLGLPMLLGWLALQGHRAGLYDAEFVLPLVMASVVVILMGLVWGTGRLLDRVDAARMREETKFRGLLQAAPDAMVIVDRQGRIALVNAQTEALFGYRPMELLGKPVETLLPERVRDRHTCYRAAFFAAPRTRSMQAGLDLLARRKDGSEFPAEIALSPLETEEGLLVTAAIRDVSENKRGQDALARRAREQAVVADFGQYALTVSDLDKLMHNAVSRMARILDIEYGAVLELLPDGRALLLRAGVGWKDGSVGRATVGAGADSQAGYTLISMEPVIVEDLRTETRFTGAPLLHEHGVVSGLSVVIQCHDRPFGVLGAHSASQRTFTQDDVHFIQSMANVLAAAIERKRADEALRDSFANLRAVVETAVDAIITIDERGLIASFNTSAERVFGYAKAEVIGQNVKMLMPEPYRSGHDGYLANYLRTGHAKIIGIGREVPARRKDGTIFQVELAITDVRLSNRRMFVGFVRDITERGQLEEQLRQSQKMEAVGRLAGGIAHDFNNMLTVITGYCQLLLDQRMADDPARKSLALIKTAAERAGALTHQLLAFSRRQILAPKVLDLNSVVANLEGMLRRLIREDIDLRLVLDPAVGRVKADAGQLEQVVMNLVLNARDAMPQGGRLTIETANVALDDAYARRHSAVQPGPYVLLAVSDTGVGMDAETQAHLFEPFFTTKEKGKGTGLGLATVYGIVKQSGGNIWVDSELGRGTTFKVYLPRVEEPVSAGPAAPVSRPPTGTETVLVVEDEEMVRALSRESLHAYGYTVLEARDGNDALQVCREHGGPIHVLIADVVMPGLSGREVAERLAPGRPAMKVLYLSGYTSDAIVHHGVLDAGTAFLQKPFTPDALARKVREVLDG